MKTITDDTTTETVEATTVPEAEDATASNDASEAVEASEETEETPEKEGGFHSELSFEERWDTDAVSTLIRSKSSLGESPAFLFLGKREAGLLREHLADHFGGDSVSSLNDTYYMGLGVIELCCDSCVHTAGRKTSRTLQDPIARRPAWRDSDYDSLWQFRAG